MKYDKLFVGGDLSGIQKFLYNISSRYASVSLKGRSAYLRKKMEAVYDGIQKVIIDAGGIVNEEDRLYCSGGKFYFITNNTLAITDAIGAFAKQEEEKLWNEHKGQLGINISYIGFKEECGEFHVEGHVDETSKNSGILWKYLNANFARQKNQKFKNILLTHPNRFFAFDTEHNDSKELVVGNGHKVCALTGVEFCIPSSEEETKYKIDDDLFYLRSAIEQIELGRELRNKEHFKTFAQYATTDNGTEGDTYLGILRMDVDGMGKKFIVGFPTLEEYKAFSNKAKIFFEEKIQKAYLMDAKYKGFLNVIYAGGDDLFVVGRWDKVIDFAKLVHDETEKEFKNDGYEDPFDTEKKKCNISISGGIAIVKPKFPITKAADKAGEAEEAAKHGEKNAFNMFGKTVSWKTAKDKDGNVIPWCDEIKEQVIKHELDYVEYFKDKFVEYVTKYSQNYGFSKSILYKIMLYSEIADMNKEREYRGRELDFSYVWHASYYLTRFMEKWGNYSRESDTTKKDVKGKLYEFCKTLRDKHLTANPRRLELMALAARWAELILKDKNKQ